MKIDYTNYLAKKAEETDERKLEAMKKAVITGLKAKNIHDRVSVKYYADGVAAVSVDGEFYNCINTATGKWFSGYVGE